MAAGPRGLGQQRRKPQNPPVDGDVVDLHAAFGQQLLHVAVRQREAQVPAHRQHDHIGWEAEAGERSPYDSGEAGTASSHSDSLPALGSITAAATVPVQVQQQAVAGGHVLEPLPLQAHGRDPRRGRPGAGRRPAARRGG
jgi:hypothetical protein